MPDVEAFDGTSDRFDDVLLARREVLVDEKCL